jgi:diketogulonate reductase-like aldo/keto reductase
MPSTWATACSTAPLGNEEAVGAAIRSHGIEQGELFVYQAVDRGCQL